MGSTSFADMVGDTLTINEGAAGALALLPGEVPGGVEASWRAPPDSLLRRVWDVRCELLRRLGSGRTEAAKAAFLSDGQFDPAATFIRTRDLISVLRERGEMPPWVLLWERHHPLESDTPKADVAPKRQQKGRSEASKRLVERYPDGIPSGVSHGVIHASLKKPGESKLPFEIDTTRRAIKELKARG